MISSTKKVKFDKASSRRSIESRGTDEITDDNGSASDDEFGTINNVYQPNVDLFGKKRPGNNKTVKNSIRGLVAGMTGLFLSKNNKRLTNSGKSHECSNTEFSESDSDSHQSFGISPAIWHASKANQSKWINTDVWKSPNPMFNMDFCQSSSRSSNRANKTSIEREVHRIRSRQKRPNRPKTSVSSKTSFALSSTKDENPKGSVHSLCNVIVEEDEEDFYTDDEDGRKRKLTTPVPNSTPNNIHSNDGDDESIDDPFQDVSYSSPYVEQSKQHKQAIRSKSSSTPKNQNSRQQSPKKLQNAANRYCTKDSRYMVYYFDPTLFDEKNSSSRHGKKKRKAKEEYL